MAWTRRFSIKGAGALLATAAAFALPAAMPASAAAACTNATPYVVYPSCFEGGDGNLTPTNADVTDWSSLASVSTVADDPGDASTFAGGNAGKQLDPDHWEFITGNNPQKVDFTAAATKTDPVSGDFFFYGAFHREGNTGDADMSFEFNQSSTPYLNAAGTSIPRRSPGDIMITFDGGASPTIGLCWWYGSPRGQSENTAFGWYQGAPPADPTVLPNGAVQVDSNTDCKPLVIGSDAVGKMNVNDPLSNPGILPNFPANMEASSFGEISVNLTKVLSAGLGANPCINYGTIWLHSRSSSTISSNMQDFIAPTTLVGGQTCGVSVDKKVAVNGGAYHEGTPSDPSYANDGDTLNYTLALTNTGVVTLTPSVTDPNCSAPTIVDADKAQQGGGADATPATFDAGDTWTYRCSHVLAPGDPEPYTNTMTGKGTIGTFVDTDTDSAATGRFGTIVIKKDQTGGSDSDKFAFTAPAALGGAFNLSESDGGNTITSVVPGTKYTVSEDALPPGSEYERGDVTCTTGGTPDNANHSADITVGPGQTVTCTYRNTRTTLVVKKVVQNNNGGTATPDKFTMNVTGVGSGNPSFAGSTAGTTVVLYPVANAGAYNVTESGGPGGYVGSIGAGCSGTPTPGTSTTCTITNTDSPAVLTVVKVVKNNGYGNAGPGDFTIKVPTGNNPSPATFPGDASGTVVNIGAGPYKVAEDPYPGWTTTYSGDCDTSIAVGESKTCTVTNSRDVGTLEVVKSLFPAADPGTFNLLEDGAVKTGAPVGDGGTTGKIVVPAGVHNVSETAAAGTSLGDYVSSIDCVKSGASVASGAGTGPLDVTVGTGDDVKCTIRNERKPKLKVVKVVDNGGIGSNKASDFTINVTGSNPSPASFPGSAGTDVAIDAGAYNVDEPAVAGWATTYSADCKGTIANGDDKTCTVTNRRKVGTLEVVKSLFPTTDSGRFSLLQDGVVKTGSPVGDGGTTGKIIVPAGAHTVGEAAGPGVTLADYVSSIDCLKSGASIASGAGSGPLNVTVGDGDTVRCTVRNERKPKLTVVKVVDNAGLGNNVPGDFTINVVGANAAPSSFPGSAGTNVKLDAGAYNVDEPAVAGWATTYSAGCNGIIANGDDRTCTVTNRRRVGTLEVVKSLIPADDTGRFDLLQDGAVKTGSPVGDGGTTGAIIVPAGDHTVGEAAAGGASLSDYVSSIDCVKSGTSVASATGSGPLTVPVGDGDAVRCTVGNTRKATVIIDKVTDPAGGTPSFPFESNLPGGNFSLKHGESHTESIAPGTATVTETDPTGAGYRLDGLVCAESKATNTTTDLGARRASIVADAGETVRCVFRNTKLEGQAVVVKSGPETAYHGDDVTYSFAVHAVGNSGLSNVVVKDDRCAPVSSAPTSRSNDNGNGTLDPVGANGTSPEVWTFTCTTKIGPHVAGETDPIINTATVTAINAAGQTVTAQSQHSTNILHPGIALTKTGPAQAVIGGQRIPWTITISNTGDTSIPKSTVSVTDPQCSSAPTLSGVNGDTTPGSLDPGDRWTYGCTSPTDADGTATSVVNTAVVTASDTGGRKVTARDTAAATVVYAATAALSRVLACPANGRTTQVLRITGRNVASVTFTVNGKVVGVARKAARTLKDGRSVFQTKFGTSKQKGAFKAVATVKYRPATGRKPTRLTTSWNFSCLTPVG